MERLIIIATNNVYKFNELRNILNYFDISCKPYWDFIDKQKFPKEGTTSLSDNSFNKAKFIFDKIKIPNVLGDDSGLFINELPNNLGITTMRELESNNCFSNYDRNKYIISLMKHCNDRSVNLITHLTLIKSEDEVLHGIGNMKGKISFIEKGINGSGFDKIFLLDKIGKTLAEFPFKDKWCFLSRTKAFRNLMEKNQ